MERNGASFSDPARISVKICRAAQNAARQTPFFTVTGGQNAIFIKKGNPFVPIAEIVMPARFSASIHAGIATP